MRRRYINFLLTYFHNSSKKAHVSSNWPAATPTGHFLSGPSARHVLVRPMLWVLSCNFNSRISHKLTNTHATARLFTISHSVTACSSPNSVTSVLDRLTVGPKRAAAAKDRFLLPAPDLIQTRRRQLLLSIDKAEGRTDTGPFHDACRMLCVPRSDLLHMLMTTAAIWQIENATK